PRRLRGLLPRILHRPLHHAHRPHELHPFPTRRSSDLGVTTVVADPHEIANVFGIRGIETMISNDTTLDIFYGIPSSVPSTNEHLDRKSTRLNSSHVSISYAVCFLKKQNAHVMRRGITM